MYSCSSSATAPNTVSMNFPVGVVVSIAFFLPANATPLAVSRSTNSGRYRVFPANRLMDSAMTASPMDVFHHLFLNLGCIHPIFAYAEDEDVMRISERLIRQNREAYEVLAK